jgi:uncharacterized membrane protein (UPF0127 family)
MGSKKTRAAEGPLTPNKKRILFLVLMALLLISGAMMFNAPKGTEVIEIRFPSGTNLQAEVAETPEKLLFGLAFREALPDDHGLLLLFEESGLHKVWTKQYQFNVDLIWVNESKHVVHIVETAVPCASDPCEWYGPSPERARYLIEANSGFVDRAQVVEGQELVFALRL